MSSPAPGATLTGSSVTFTGGHTSQDTNHWLYVGTSRGAKNLYDSGALGTTHAVTATGLPTTGTIYVRYWSTNVGDSTSGWVFHDHTYTMAVGGGSSSSSGTATFPAPLSAPAPGE